MAQSGEDRFVPIVSALQNKEFDKALALIEPALQAAPGNAQLWAMQGAAYSGKADEKGAIASFQKALKISPNYPPALEGAIQIEFEGGDPSAIPLLQRILRMRPADTISHGMLAILEYQQGNCAAALPHFEKAEALFDSKPSALHAYANCLVKLKQYDRAAKVFQRTLTLKPDDPQERHLLAAVQLMANQPQDALATLQPLLEQKDLDAGTLELASAAYEANKDTTQAVNLLRQAILLDPRNVNLYLDFANITYTHGAFQVGIDVMNDGLALEPKASALYFARGVLYVQMAKYDKGEADFEKAYELDPSQSISTAALGLAAEQQNDFDRALEKVQASLKKKPNDPLMLYMQADIIAAKNADPQTAEFQLAVRSAEKAVALQPSLGAARGVLGKLYLETGQYQQAIEQCRKALESDPTDQKTMYHLIQALRKTGDTKEIPDLLKRLASLREQDLKKDKERYRYKLVD
ncbi:MAG TPA: tetratricopeptide repeat protein [Terriglobales bacterium]|jgi:tetratricopeptide (TPR) repeat protein